MAFFLLGTRWDTRLRPLKIEKTVERRSLGGGQSIYTSSIIRSINPLDMTTVLMLARMMAWSISSSKAPLSNFKARKKTVIRLRKVFPRQFFGIPLRMDIKKYNLPVSYSSLRRRYTWPNVICVEMKKDTMIII